MQRIKAIGIFSAGVLCGVLIHWMPAPSASASGNRVGDGGIAGGGAEGGGNKCRADIAPSPNGDGVVNVSDLLAVISAWGPCPIDADGDGWTVAEGDCDDTNPNVYPGAPDICNHIDDDCDTQIDENSPPDGAEPNDVCATTATDLGMIAGDEAGPPLTFTGNLIPGGDNDFFRFLGVEANTVGIEDLLARVTLVVPPDASAPCLLLAYCNSCGALPVSKLVNPGQSDSITVTWEDQSGIPNNKTIFIEVRQSGSTIGECLSYELTIEGDVGAVDVTCP